MRIAFIVPYLYRFQRGIESSACRLASALAGLGHEVTILTWGQRNRSANHNLSPEVRIRCVPYFRYFRSVVAVPFYVNFLKRGGFDLVNIYFGDCGEAMPIKLTKARCGYRVQFIAGYPTDQVPHRYDAFDRLGLTPLIDRVVAKSPAMVEGLQSRLGRPTVMIPNGVDTDYFCPDRFPRDVCRADLNLGPDDKVVVSVAAFEERKGIQHMIRAIPRLLGRHHQIQYLIAGEGEFKTSLESEIARFGLEKRVRFVGRLHDVRPLLVAADAMVLLSYGEGLPNVILEAWAMGLPVLVSRHPPFPDLVSDDLGLMVDEESPEQVAGGLEDLLAPGWQAGAGRRRRHVIDRYKWTNIAAQIAT